MTEETRELSDNYGGAWGEHPEYPARDWKYEVANDDTRLGYWDWVCSQVSGDAFADLLKPSGA